jgi:hypothetical protein
MRVSVPRKVGEKAHDQPYIVTVPGSGYRFAAKMRELDVESKGQDSLLVSSCAWARLVIEECVRPRRDRVDIPFHWRQ